MIKSLRIKNLATIEDIDIFLDEGFSILTGETGVGKSILIESIKLALGEKSSPDIIRTGKPDTSIEAIFRMPPDDTDLHESTVKDGDECFIQRKIPRRGLSKGYIDGTLMPIKKLREKRDALVDIYGQNDHVFLRHADNHLTYLDGYAQALPLKDQVSQFARKLRKLYKEKEKLESQAREREQRLDFLLFQIREIEDAHLVPEEEEDLQKERHILKNVEKINQGIDEALDITYTQDQSLLSLLTKLQNIVDDLQKYYEEMKETGEAIHQFSIDMKEFSEFLLKSGERQEDSHERLEEVEARLSLIEGLKRKYGNSIKEILEYLEKAKHEHHSLDRFQERQSTLDQEIEQIFSLYKESAQKLRKVREKSAVDLEKQIIKEIALLGMKKARFEIAINSTPPTLDQINSIKEAGNEEVEFLLSTNPGEDLKPLRKIASGGELSRFMLALKSIGKNTEKQKTLIFDEIDAGIGGKTAEFVARKLHALSQENQVICITHLPQIASYALHHYKIDKKIENERTFTTVKKLFYKERVTEIARLLTGSHITKTTMQNASEMLDRNLAYGKKKPRQP